MKKDFFDSLTFENQVRVAEDRGRFVGAKEKEGAKFKAYDLESFYVIIRYQDNVAESLESRAGGGEYAGIKLSSFTSARPAPNCFDPNSEAFLLYHKIIVP